MIARVGMHNVPLFSTCAEAIAVHEEGCNAMTMPAFYVRDLCPKSCCKYFFRWYSLKITILSVFSEKNFDCTYRIIKLKLRKKAEPEFVFSVTLLHIRLKNYYCLKKSFPHTIF